MVRRLSGVQVFVEGGGKGDSSLIECRKAFSRLIERAGFNDRMPKVVACGSRSQAFARFEQACKESVRDSILLVDSEAPVTHKSPWDHVRMREGDKWIKPTNASDSDLHFMVECMEAWIVADRQAMRDVYKQELRENALPVRKDVEKIPKLDLYDSLDKATRHDYRKGSDAFKLLGAIDPETLRKSCPWAERFFSELHRRLTGSSLR